VTNNPPGLGLSPSPLRSPPAPRAFRKNCHERRTLLNAMTELIYDFDAGTVDDTKPLIYLWEVIDHDDGLVYCYVGKAKNGAGRPQKHYARNVRNLFLGRPYRKGKQENFRQVHRQLALAMQSQHRIVLRLIRNVMPNEDINTVEREEQVRHGCPQ
jgi:hypothetical protein